ncbi:2Fe-2S iron-sulfur cluster-binding protein [Ancylobacter sp. TS-1]|uniref:2Fe-2S iron-sulfur cluster-binding protein n=1 Tax=Ancylobacter sp. TS-1 TaxID=1850374 RepID=UPI001265B2B5|nr:2Fe-2S iron-sulfur cluster-binding protein [Ancylobacter sp. TS-1]QFR33783.1 2Fe-2S iron-sulfur cluster binding domain-containing protein [Ancylobacter sp. TS-1]
MPRITFRTHDEELFFVDAPDGTSLMQAAIDNGVPGILGDCGGGCSCATCHVFVAEEWEPRLGAPSASERALLTGREDLAPNSRLGCQIVLGPGLDGLTVLLPESQY